MRRRRNILLCAATVLMCAVSLVLPGAVLALRDVSLARSAETVAVDEVELNLLSRLDPVSKLALAGDASAVSIPLDGGRNLKREDAYDAAYNWSADLGIQFSDAREREARAELRVNSAGEGAVMWNVTVSGPGETGNFIIDDETGDVLGAFVFRGGTAVGDGYSREQTDGEIDADGGVELDVCPAEETAGEYKASGAAGEGFEYDNIQGAGESGTEDVTPDEEFQYGAEFFLDRLGIEYTRITRKSDDSAAIRIDGGSGTLELPMSLKGDGDVSYIRVNMPDAAGAASAPAP